MKIRKGEKLRVTCSRKGTYNAVATDDFDTLKDEWYQIAVDQDEPIHGMSFNKTWERGDAVPCRRGQAVIKRRKE